MCIDPEAEKSQCIYGFCLQIQSPRDTVKKGVCVEYEFLSSHSKTHTQTLHLRVQVQ
jgi:hypothetical protein